MRSSGKCPAQRSLSTKTIGSRRHSAAPTGRDAGRQALADEPYGPILLVVLALGLIAFGAYCFLDARYRKA